MELERRQLGPHRHAGQGVVEYGLLVFMISVAVLGIMFLLADQFGNIFSNVASSI